MIVALACSRETLEIFDYDPLGLGTPSDPESLERFREYVEDLNKA